jgi:hypothetical protein
LLKPRRQQPFIHGHIFHLWSLALLFQSFVPARTAFRLLTEGANYLKSTTTRSTICLTLPWRPSPHET